MSEPTGRLRWYEVNGSMELQQQWGHKNNWAWSGLEWITVPTVQATVPVMLCDICNCTQFNTPSGITCPNGHGGADGHLDK